MFSEQFGQQPATVVGEAHGGVLGPTEAADRLHSDVPETHGQQGGADGHHFGEQVSVCRRKPDAALSVGAASRTALGQPGIRKGSCQFGDHFVVQDLGGVHRRVQLVRDI